MSFKSQAVRLKALAKQFGNWQPQLVGGLQQTFQPQPLLPAIGIGLTTGILGVLFDLSFAALIFSNSLSEHLSAGIGFVLFSAAATRIVVALMSSFPGMVADLEAVPTAILAWSTGMVIRQMPQSATSTELLVTVIMTISLTSLLTGLFLLGIGALKLGNVVRLLPYPVLGGFVASTGWLLVKGAFNITLGQPLTLESVFMLSEPASLIRWLPGLLLTSSLVLLARRYRHPSIMPVSLMVAVCLFYLGLPALGSSVEQISAQGLTLGIPAFQTTWQVLSLADLGQVNWQAIWSQWMCSVTVIVTTAILLMMNVKVMELVSENEIDTNHELRVAGTANILLGLGGGILSFQSMGKSVLSHKMGNRQRLTTIVSAIAFILIPLLGSSLISYFPKSILGGLLLYMGVCVLSEWICGTWKKLSWFEYSIVQMIWLVSAIVGFLQGLAVGWAIALGLLLYHRAKPTPATP